MSVRQLGLAAAISLVGGYLIYAFVYVVVVLARPELADDGPVGAAALLFFMPLSSVSMFLLFWNLGLRKAATVSTAVLGALAALGLVALLGLGLALHLDSATGAALPVSAVGVLIWALPAVRQSRSLAAWYSRRLGVAPDGPAVGAVPPRVAGIGHPASSAKPFQPARLLPTVWPGPTSGWASRSPGPGRRSSAVHGPVGTVAPLATPTSASRVRQVPVVADQPESGIRRTAARPTLVPRAPQAATVQPNASASPSPTVMPLHDRILTLAEGTAIRYAPILESGLIAAYGGNWLERVNYNRKKAGKPPGWSLKDFRFCLAVLGYDPATKDWLPEIQRRNARQLNGIANSAAHRATLTGNDLTRAESAARDLVNILPSLQ